MVDLWSFVGSFHHMDGCLSQKHFFIDPHQAACLIGFALILDAVEAVSPLAVVPLVVVVEFHLPHGLK